MKSFADKETERIYNQEASRRLPADIQKIALRKLILIDNAESLKDLRVPPGNHLEELKGDRQGQHSIRINAKYRICFTADEEGFHNVEIIDYH
ncbi:MAG: type II toxin-antitoxin system RelE/ParE family toxin [Firmicutes bacterium]|nr:type II toxin-antitoxin system RelE/ParE family toxin [Bacillota bacterium]